MSDIELVIKIPKELYEAYKCRPPMLGDTGMDMIAQSIANGTPLPKGHGRLKDVDRLESHDEYDGQGFTKSVYKDDIDNAPTIIESDKESEE